MSRVVCAEKSKTALGFEIGPWQEVMMTAQCLTDGQSSCMVRADGLSQWADEDAETRGVIMT